MNNFVFSQDPLLYGSMLSRQAPQNDYDVKKQLDDAMTQYQQLMMNQQAQNAQNQQKDYLGEIDNMISTLDEDVALALSADVEYLKLNEDLQKMIQEEMMKSIRWKLNSNPDAVAKMDRLKTLITNAKKVKSDEDRKTMADINDYIKNYADLTFEEYKQLKYGK